MTVIVTDNQSNTPQTFVFTGLGANADFSRIGVISNDGETIKTIELIAAGDGFKEVKQLRISGPEVPPVVPDGGATVMLLGAALSVLGMTRRFFKK